MDDRRLAMRYRTDHAERILKRPFATRRTPTRLRMRQIKKTTPYGAVLLCSLACGMNAVGVGSPHDFDLLEWLERRLAFGSFAFSGRSRGFGSMTIRLQSRHVKREFPEGAVQVVAKKLRRSLCNTKGAPEMTESQKVAPIGRARKTKTNPGLNFSAAAIQAINEAKAECERLTAMDVAAQELDGRARHTIARQDGDIRRLLKDIAELEARNDVAITNMLKWQQRCEMETIVTARALTERHEARRLIAALVSNDPNDNAAPGAISYAVWKQEAERFLRGQGGA